MNQKSKGSCISLKSSGEVSHKDVAVSTESSGKLHDGGTSARSNEDALGVLSKKTSEEALDHKDREPIFVIVDSSCISNPSSLELLIDEKMIKGPLNKHINKNVQPIDMPSTSRDFRNDFTPLKRSYSSDELQMIDINLQSENEIPVGENDVDEESIVLSYLRNKDAKLNLESTALLSSKKKSSLLEDVPKMETIVEGERFSAFPLHPPNSDLSQEKEFEDTEPE